jgi:hypothetical protein
MSVVINYKFGAQCSEEELVAKLERIRAGSTALEDVVPGPIRRIQPCYSKTLFKELEAARIKLPPAVAERVKEAKRKNDDFTELWVGLSALDPEERLRFTDPALEMMNSTDLWNAEDYPSEFSASAMAYNRGGIMLEFANALLLRGFVLTIRLGEGCDPMTIPLASYRTPGVPVWRGGGFTRTQYAVHFTRDHEHVCHILDFAKNEGLLLEATDTCDFYKHRDWHRSAPVVNRETDFIAAVSAAFDRTTRRQPSD